jgi:Terminase small subunit
MALSEKHEQVINEYVQCWNKTEAYRRVYQNTNERSARSAAHRLFTNVDFTEALSNKISESGMSADEVLRRLAEQARNEHGKYINTKPRLDMVAMAKDNKGDLIPDAIDENGDIDIVRLALEGKLEIYAPYIYSGGYVDLAALEREGKMHLIKGIKSTKDGLQVEFYDAQAALVHLGKYHALFTEKQELTGKDGGPIQTTVKHDLSRLSVDELKAMREMVTKAANVDS